MSTDGTAVAAVAPLVRGGAASSPLPLPPFAAFAPLPAARDGPSAAADILGERGGKGEGEEDDGSEGWV